MKSFNYLYCLYLGFSDFVSICNNCQYLKKINLISKINYLFCQVSLKKWKYKKKTMLNQSRLNLMQTRLFRKMLVVIKLGNSQMTFKQ